MPIAGKPINQIVEQNFYVKSNFIICFPDDLEKRNELYEAYNKMVNADIKNNKEVVELSIQDERVIAFYNEYSKGHLVKNIAANNMVSTDTVYRAIRIIKSLIKKLN